MDDLFKVIYKGQLQSGFPPSEVISELTNLFNISEERATSIVHTKKTLILKNNASAKLAAKYELKLNQIGLSVSVIPVSSQKLQEKPVAPITSESPDTTDKTVVENKADSPAAADKTNVTDTADTAEPTDTTDVTDPVDKLSVDTSEVVEVPVTPLASDTAEADDSFKNTYPDDMTGRQEKDKERFSSLQEPPPIDTQPFLTERQEPDAPQKPAKNNPVLNYINYGLIPFLILLYGVGYVFPMKPFYKISDISSGPYDPKKHQIFEVSKKLFFLPGPKTIWCKRLEDGYIFYRDLEDIIDRDTKPMFFSKLQEQDDKSTAN
ncbi:MAG: hypothetical protein D6B25_01055 [Desulfobulbaceae bacterium]|nr:MAG: hypothetical protein D6B25_01055 [Desulfobulbaceae bacterium]